MNSKWESVKDIIVKVAPGLAAGLGGPMAGAATAFILKSLGLKVGEEDQAIEALKTSPDAILKLKLAEIDFKKFLEEGKIKLFEMDVQDRASARSLAVAQGLTVQTALAIVYTIGYFTMIFGIMTGELHIPNASGEQALFAGLIGVMTGAQVQILNFFFGSSSSSARKDQALTNLSS
jgi:hypothetical protein